MSGIAKVAGVDCDSLQRRRVRPLFGEKLLLACWCRRVFDVWLEKKMK